MIDTRRLQDENDRSEVLDTLVRDYSKSVRKYCVARIGEELADEITQEVFITVWADLQKYNPQVPMVSWLLGIAHRKCQQAFRNRTRRHAIARAFFEEIRQQAHIAPPKSPEELATEIEDLVTERAESARIYDAITRLRQDDRILLTLRFMRGMPISEICALVGMSESAVRKRLQRTIYQIREKMRDHL